MSFSSMVNFLQEMNKEKIVLIKCGVFYIAKGRDAVFLSDTLKLKVTCMENAVCKVGIPINSLEKYLTKLDQLNYGYIVYDYSNKENKIEEKIKKDGKIHSELKKEEYIKWLYEQLKNGTYKHGGYTTFYVTEPKLRKIEKSKYIDRIVHRFYVDNFMKPYFGVQFIYNSYACIQNKGMHNVVLDLQKAMRHCKIIWENYYILKMDIRKFFDNIDKDILYEILERKIKDKKVLWLTREIIYSINRKKGMEIGNYTSQMFANIYLNEIDQYAKHTLKCKYYFRYLDDTVILLRTKEEAQLVLKKIQVFLKEKLELELNEKTQIFKNKQGVNFC